MPFLFSATQVISWLCTCRFIWLSKEPALGYQITECHLSWDFQLVYQFQIYPHPQAQDLYLPLSSIIQFPSSHLLHSPSPPYFSPLLCLPLLIYLHSSLLLYSLIQSSHFLSFLNSNFALLLQSPVLFHVTQFLSLSFFIVEAYIPAPSSF